MSIVIIIVHVLVDIVCGLSILLSQNIKQVGFFEIAKSLALGIFVETMFIGVLHYCGVSILIGFIIFALISAGILVFFWIKEKNILSWNEPLLKFRLSIWEVLISLVIVEKFVWSTVNLVKLPVYFDDTLNHWSGRGKALLTGTNWSWDPESMYFLGKTFGHMEYPLLASIWRAVNGALLGGSNTSATERLDGLIMWLIIIITATVWIYRITGKRWLGLSGAMIIASMPLEAWHMTAGYAEILIQGYLLLCFWAILNKKYLLGGIFGAAMVWSKNEGLILFIPCVILCLSFYLLVTKEIIWKDKVSAFLTYNFTWMLCISPWLIFKLVNGVGLTIPGDSNLGYVDGALTKLGHALFNSASSSFLWVFLILAFILCALKILKDQQLLTMAMGSVVLLAMMTLVFTSTSAYIFLENQMTIHRSILQIAPIFIITIAVALGSSSRDEDFDTKVLI